MHCISKMEGLEAYGISKGSQNLQPFVPEKIRSQWVWIGAQMNRLEPQSKCILEPMVTHLR